MQRPETAQRPPDWQQSSVLSTEDNEARERRQAAEACHFSATGYHIWWFMPHIVWRFSLSPGQREATKQKDWRWCPACERREYAPKE